jgi:hypothetical protein
LTHGKKNTQVIHSLGMVKFSTLEAFLPNFQQKLYIFQKTPLQKSTQHEAIFNHSKTRVKN